MTFTTYGLRVPAHPTRTGAFRGIEGIRLLVIHTSEGAELTTSAEALARFIGTPRTADNLASYHYVADTDRVIPVVPDDYVAYANAGANHDGLSICYPGKAAQTPEEWHDTNSDAMHEQVARWLADKSEQYRIPLRKLTFSQVAAGERGVCGHLEVTLAYKRSTHTDPGAYFPWTSVLSRAVSLLEPPLPTIPPAPGDVMEIRAILVRHVDGRMFCTDMRSYANYCTEDEGGVLRDKWGAEVQPPGSKDSPWPLSKVESGYVARMAGV